VISAGRQLLNSDDIPTQSRAVMSPECVFLQIAFTLLVKPDISFSVTKRKKVETKSSSHGVKPKRRYQEQVRGRSRVHKDLRGGAARADYDISRLDGSTSEADGSGSGSFRFV
jgi:hypothetical protein